MIPALNVLGSFQGSCPVWWTLELWQLHSVKKCRTKLMNNIITATSELYLHDILEKKIIYLKQNSQLEDDHYIIETDTSQILYYLSFYGFGTTWVGVDDVRILHFAWSL